MSDDLAARRIRRTMQGVVCTLGLEGQMHPDDLAEIEKFKRYLIQLPSRASREERQRLYAEIYEEQP